MESAEQLVVCDHEAHRRVNRPVKGMSHSLNLALKGLLPEGVNIAKKASHVLTLLDCFANQDSSLPDREVHLEDLYQAMLAKVVLIATESK